LTTGPLSLLIFDVSGRILHSSIVSRHSSIRLDLRSLPVGVYLVKLSSDGLSATQKLVVQK